MFVPLLATHVNKKYCTYDSSIKKKLFQSHTYHKWFFVKQSKIIELLCIFLYSLGMLMHLFFFSYSFFSYLEYKQRKRVNKQCTYLCT